MTKNKKQCGYLDNHENFHKTLFDCNNANLKIRMWSLQEKIQNLNISYSRRFASRLSETQSEVYKKTPSHIIERIFLEVLVNNRELFLMYIEEIREIEKKYNSLEYKEGLPKFLRKDWWLNEEISI